MSSKPEAVPAVKTGKAVAQRTQVNALPESRIIIVLGMHRSGTSVITRALQALGVSLGDHLIGGVEGDNDKGFWEDLDFHGMNERLLSKSGSAWDRLSKVDVQKFYGSEFASERIDAAAILKQKMYGVDVFAFKDPRTAVTLPFWQCVLEDMGIEPTYVVAVRNPMEIAASLSRRDGFDQVKSLQLWLKHTYSAVKHTEGLQRVIVRYEDVVDDPETQLSRIARALDLKMPSAGSEAMQTYTKEFLDPALHRNRISARELGRSDNVPDVVEDLFLLIEQWINQLDGVETVAPEALLARIDAYLSEVDPLLSYLDRAEIKISGLAQQLSGTENALKVQAAELESVRQELALRKDDLNAAQTRLEETEAAVAEARGRADVLAQELGASKQHVVMLDARIQENQARIGEIETLRRDELEAAQMQERALRQQVEAVRTEIEQTGAALAEAKQRETLLESQKLAVEESASKLEATLAATEETLSLTTARADKLQSDLEDASVRTSFLNGKLIAAEVDLAEARSIADGMKQDLTLAQHDLAQAQARIENVETELARREAAAIRYEYDLEARQTELAKIREMFADSQHALAEVEVRAAEVPHLQSELSDALLQLGRQNSVTLALGAEATELRKQLRLQRAGLLEMRDSTSWRLTRPVRVLKQGLTRLFSVAKQKRNDDRL